MTLFGSPAATSSSTLRSRSVNDTARACSWALSSRSSCAVSFQFSSSACSERKRKFGFECRSPRQCGEQRYLALHQRTNILVQVEEVARVILCFDFSEAPVILAVSRRDRVSGLVVI